jgi:DNA-binding NtrC family response regulator
MQGMNGVDLAAQAVRERPGLPVLLMTGYPETAKFASQRLPARILDKPFPVAELAAAVDEMLQPGAGPSHDGAC